MKRNSAVEYFTEREIPVYPVRLLSNVTQVNHFIMLDSLKINFFQLTSLQMKMTGKTSRKMSKANVNTVDNKTF